MLKFTGKLLAAAVATVILAVVLLARNISDSMDEMNIQNGDWTTSIDIGSQDASVLLKAAVAVGGILASTPESSMYYRLNAVNGEPLRTHCRYRIEGGDYDADWWSVTAYGWDNYLIPNSEKRYSFNNENIERGADGRWTIIVDTRQHPGNWLPVGPSGAPTWRKLGDYDFDLLFRLYRPGNAYLTMPQSAELPTVTQETCE